MWPIIILALLAAGCSSISNVSYPLADGTFKNQRTVSDPHAFSPTHTRSWIEVCLPDPTNPKAPDYTNCNHVEDARYATSSGFADGLGAAALYSGAIVGGAGLIGNGIAQSGSHVTQSSGGANASTSDQIVQQNHFGGRR